MNQGQALKLDSYPAAVRGHARRSAGIAWTRLRHRGRRAFLLAVLVVDVILFAELTQGAVHVQFLDAPHALPQPGSIRWDG